MTSAQLIARFSKGVQWNAFFYGAYKLFSTMINLLLYARMDAILFCAYSNINSIIYLTLLLLDIGFSKAIPRFCPVYAKDHQALSRFVKNILTAKIALLAFVIPLFLHKTEGVIQAFQLRHLSSCIYAGVMLLFIEGIASVLRLIYHAYFWQKTYNLMHTSALIIQASLTALAIGILKDQYLLLNMLIWIKICSSIILIVLASIRLPSLFMHISLETNHEHIDYHAVNRQFILHTSIMWINTNIKSLTERNVLLPIFTYVYGPIIANIYKVANDGALLFYRMVLKTIGTSDTALFAHMLVMQERKPIWQVAFNNLTTKITALCIPLSGIIWILYRYKIVFKFYDQSVFQAFLIISISFLIEAVFSPCERILEVKRNYIWLFLSYIPYICLIVIFSTTNIMTSIGLFNSLFLIHVVRLVSALLTLIITHTQYHLYFPFRFFIFLTVSTFICMHLLIWVIYTLSYVFG